MKFVEDRPFARPEVAARKLLDIVLSHEITVGTYTYVGKTNTEFMSAGGNVDEYTAGRDYAVEQKWFEVDRSGSRIILLQAGADLTA